MIRICMITYDQLEKKNPRADLIRFKNIGKALHKQSVEVVYITSAERCRYEEKNIDYAKVYKVPCLSNSNLIRLFFFYIFLLPILPQVKKTGNCNIIFVNSILTIPIAWVLKFIFKDAYIQFDLMGILSEEKFIRLPKNNLIKITKKIFSLIEIYLWSRVDFITTINEQHKRLLLERIKKPIYVIRDGVFEGVLENTSLLSKKSNQNSKVILIFVGQINYFRLDPLFRILPTLISEVPFLQIQVLGEGPQLNRYKKIVLNLGLKDYVSFLGYIPYGEIFNYIEKADIAYSDDWSINGFPSKLFDYMAMGKAIVAEETESVKEILTDQINALLYKNEDELKEKIIKLAKDITLREKIGKEAQKIMNQHIWERKGEILEKIYLQFICRSKDIISAEKYISFNSKTEKIELSKTNNQNDEK